MSNDAEKKNITKKTYLICHRFSFSDKIFKKKNERKASKKFELEYSILANLNPKFGHHLKMKIMNENFFFPAPILKKILSHKNQQLAPVIFTNLFFILH